MKQILILLFILSAIVACAQTTTEFADLPAKGSTSGGDELTVVASSIPYKMTYSVLFAATNAELGVIDDSITNYDLRLLALETGSGSTDSSWVSIGADTIYIDQARSGTHFTDGDAEELKINISGASTVSITNGNFSIGEDRTLIVSNPISTDSIYEFTPNNGIDIEGIHIQDYSVVLDTMRFNDTNTEIWEDGLSNLSFKDAVTGTKTLAELNGVASISYTNCPDNTTTNITIGTTSDVSFRLHYVSERNTGTVQKQSGMIDVLHDDLTGTPYYSSDFIGADLGFTITADESGGNIRLNIIVDNSTANDLSFDFKIISKFDE